MRASLFLSTFMLPALLAAAWAGSIIAFGDTPAVYAPGLLLFAAAGSAFTVAAVLLHKPTLMALTFSAIILISLTFRLREPGEVGLDWQALYKVSFWGIFLLVYLVNFPRTVRYLRDPVIFLWGGFTLISVASSIYSPTPLVSFAAAMGTVAYYGFALILVEALGPRLSVMTLFWAMLVYLVINALSPLFAGDFAWMLTDPATGILRFQGLSGQPNSLGRQSSIFMLVSIAAYQRDYIPKWLNIALCLLALSLAASTDSRTAVIAVLAGLALTMRVRYLFPLVFAGATALVLLWFTGTIDLILGALGRQGNADEAVSMAGRTDIWAFAWDEIWVHPLIGHGYSSFETWASEHWTGVDKGIAFATHNSYLEAWYSTGLIGLLFFVGAFLVSVWRWLVRPDVARDATMWALLIAGVTEVELTTVAIFPSFMFLVMLALDFRKQEGVYA
jgi:O-antigen ligase